MTLQKNLPEIGQLGAKRVAISPETPDNSLSTREKHAIAFDVLYDKDNDVAERYGLVFTLDEELRPIYGKLGIDIPAFNRDDTFKLPIPATYVIARDGSVAYAFAGGNIYQTVGTRRDYSGAQVIITLRTAEHDQNISRLFHLYIKKQNAL